MNDTGTDFYTPPTLHDSIEPGRILRIRPTDTPALIGAGAAWQLLYTSTDTHGELTTASGIVIAPDTDPELGPGPILLYCPAFHGLGGACAPSRLLAIGAEPDTAPITAALERGWMVAVPDGENLGVTGQGPHTFLAARAAAHHTLDLTRAAAAIPDLNAQGSPVVAWGYADGARAVTVAAQLHRSYAPEVDLRGIAAGATITVPGALAASLNTSPFSALMLAGLIGLSRAYHHLPLRYVLSADGRQVIAEAETRSAPMLLAQYRRPIEHWCDRGQPWTDPMWHYVLARETIPVDQLPGVPVHLYHGARDALVPIGQSTRLLSAYREGGVEVSWRNYDRGHLDTARDAITETVARLADYLSRPSEG
ncbi:putative inactive lipase [Nocardia cerradoensis]|uniref:Putative inactive lipase n=1 Tax=Nocardia cerradoensis TaxID=85688 RepID=A0A231H3B7_9NOCA|nr:lipase family protein [Nocardia cerradoensis]OXR43355.1 putative inactive lipase [Nocardia cerradoensis]